MAYEHLLFRRQFLMTPDKCGTLEHWHHRPLGKFHIYAHPDVELNIVDGNHAKPSMALVGYIIDPDHPARGNVDILTDMRNSVHSVGQICEYLYDLSGRFVLIVDSPDDILIFHDPSGFRSVFYTRMYGKTLVGSQPLIFEQVIPLRRGTRFTTYNDSEYKRSHFEHGIPSGCSLFEGVSHLVPNHYLRLSTLEQIRYWPNQRLQSEPLEKVIGQASMLLENLMKAANARFSLAVSLTSGLDSRIVLSACRAIAPDVYFYTLQYRDLTVQSPDIAIPKALLHSLGLEHHVIDCRVETDPDFDQVYRLNTPMAHSNDWGKTAYGMMVGGYPSERVAVKNVCSETCRCLYYPEGHHQPIETPDEFIHMVKGIYGWEGLPFIYAQIANWYNGLYPVAEANGIDILDLFFWEHREGSWQAQSQLEWDVVQEVYCAFNHRRLLETMLSVPAKYRCAPDYVLYREICRVLWPAVLAEPINPPSSVKEWLSKAMYKIGIGDFARSIYRSFTGKAA